MSGIGSRTRSGVLQVRQVYSAVHKDRPCQPCKLCKQGNQSKYFHPKLWKDPTLLERLKQCEPSLNILPETCICRLCRDDLSKLDDIDYIPRWIKISQTRDKKTCYVPGCSASCYKVTKLASEATLNRLFDAPCENESPLLGKDQHDGCPLCQEHYGVLYRHLNPTHFIKKCKTCNKLLLDLTKTRKCPEPTLVQSFLRENTEFTEEMKPDDRVCYACYKSHLVIIKHTQNSSFSTDAELHQLTTKLKSELADIIDVTTLDHAISYAAHFSAIVVGDALLKHNALLLPDVYDSFLDKLNQVIQLRGIAGCTDIGSTVTPNWLRSQLSSLLDHHMAFRCSVRKYGTVLYRHGGDLLHALNVNLGQMRHQSRQSDHNREGTDPVVEKNESDFQEKLGEVCLALNSKIHTCINNIQKEDIDEPVSIEDIDMNKFIGNLDPDVWQAICLLTQPLSARAIRATSHVRKTTRFFCTCLLMFATNCHSTLPMHTFVTDVIETCGGNNRLIRFLNRLGVCASTDTHARYVQYRIKKSLKEGAMSGCPQDAFTLASVDNIDYVHSYARVYCGKQQSSWHGTTVQIVQPQPTVLIDREAMTQTRAETTASSDTHLPTEPQSPAPAPPEVRLSKRLYSTRSPLTKPRSPNRHSPVPKRQRRMRTGTEGACMSQTSTQPITQTDFNRQDEPLNQQPSTVTVNDFKLQTNETKATQELSEIASKYILQRVANSTNSTVLIDFQTYFTLYNDLQSPERPRTNIIYYQVIDQKCDNKETLMNVINSLYAEFIKTNQKKWIILEGDQDTYNRLQLLKTEYGNDLSWMIPMPGDWHI